MKKRYKLKRLFLRNYPEETIDSYAPSILKNPKDRGLLNELLYYTFSIGYLKGNHAGTMEIHSKYMKDLEQIRKKLHQISGQKNE